MGDVRPRPDVRTGPFATSEQALEAMRAQGIVDAEVVRMPSGAWYLTQARVRPVRCGDCWTETWSSTGFCPGHLEARGYAVAKRRSSWRATGEVA